MKSFESEQTGQRHRADEDHQLKSPFANSAEAKSAVAATQLSLISLRNTINESFQFERGPQEVDIQNMMDWKLGEECHARFTNIWYNKVFRLYGEWQVPLVQRFREKKGPHQSGSN